MIEREQFLIDTVTVLLEQVSILTAQMETLKGSLGDQCRINETTHNIIITHNNTLEALINEKI